MPLGIEEAINIMHALQLREALRAGWKKTPCWWLDPMDRLDEPPMALQDIEGKPVSDEMLLLTDERIAMLKRMNISLDTLLASGQLYVIDDHVETTKPVYGLGHYLPSPNDSALEGYGIARAYRLELTPEDRAMAENALFQYDLFLDIGAVRTLAASPQKSGPG